MEKNCLKNVLELIQQTVYQRRCKKREQDFTRERAMMFNEIVFVILGMLKESTQNMLERVFPQLKKQNLCMSQ